MKTCTSTLFVVVWLLAIGCASEETRDEDFHTSGSREADQRAEQRITKLQQMRGEGGEEAKDRAKPSLYERLGAAAGVRMIVDDFVDRAIADPRANWERKGVKRGGVLGIGASSAEWRATADNVARLKERMVEFITVATGGPTRYEGRDMKVVHDGMAITNTEFDATIGALKASMDVTGIPTEEQKELLAIFESTRPQIAEKR